MKLIIIEHELAECNSFSTITANNNFQSSWEQTCEEYNVTPEMIERMSNGEVIAWVEAVNSFGIKVKRTYMIAK